MHQKGLPLWQTVWNYMQGYTLPREQDPEDQMRFLRQYGESRKLKIYVEYGGHGSGRKGDRTEYHELIQAVPKCKLDVMMVRKFNGTDGRPLPPPQVLLVRPK